MNYHKILSWTALITSLFLVILPKYVAICTGYTAGGNPMQCHYTYQAEFLITLLAIILSASLLVLRTAEAKLLASFVIFLLGIIVIVLPEPWVIGICKNGACLKTTFFARIGGSILVISGLLLTLLNRKRQAEEIT